MQTAGNDATVSDGFSPPEFNSVPIENSGLYLTGQVRDMVSLTYRNKEALLIAKNNDEIQVYEIMAK